MQPKLYSIFEAVIIPTQLLKTSSIKSLSINDIIQILGDLDQGDGLYIHISENRFKQIPNYDFTYLINH